MREKFRSFHVAQGIRREQDFYPLHQGVDTSLSSRVRGVLTDPLLVILHRRARDDLAAQLFAGSIENDHGRKTANAIEIDQTQVIRFCFGLVCRNIDGLKAYLVGGEFLPCRTGDYVSIKVPAGRTPFRTGEKDNPDFLFCLQSLHWC